MSLTGIPLIAVAVLVTLLAAAATVVVWGRGGRARVVLRSGALLLTEVLVLVSVGLVVNRSEGFYPTWATLSQSGHTSGTTFAVTPGELDGWLRANGPAFRWQPAGWTGWHLAQPPVVVVPAGYLDHPKWRYSAVVVVDRGAGWTPAAPDSAVVAFVRTTASTSVNTLARDLPAALAHDLRVTGKRWALVAGASDATLARRVVVAAPGRYPAIAVLPAIGRNSPRTASAPIKTQRHAPPAGPPLPAGIAVAGPADDRTGPAALTWAVEQTPAPLAASAPAVTSLPAQPAKHHHRPKRAEPRTGAKNVSGQPRH
ncbi:hypothetical protein [Actinoplanes sp. HUAS TT8]|uniref:hypothetical protein n=1 Tax=Actinoplanes sp. HUAS TT8 TaxID=3447453 RepID=UPI003F527973